MSDQEIVDPGWAASDRTQTSGGEDTMIDDHNGRFGDGPAADRDNPILDVELGAVLTRITYHPYTSGGLPPEALHEIELAITLAWPDGSPPTAAQLAYEDDADFSAAHERGWQ
jgi:hypothetical protein